MLGGGEINYGVGACSDPCSLFGIGLTCLAVENGEGGDAGNGEPEVIIGFLESYAEGSVIGSGEGFNLSSYLGVNTASGVINTIKEDKYCGREEISAIKNLLSEGTMKLIKMRKLPKESGLRESHNIDII